MAAAGNYPVERLIFFLYSSLPLLSFFHASKQRWCDEGYDQGNCFQNRLGNSSSLHIEIIQHASSLQGEPFPKCQDPHHGTIAQSFYKENDGKTEWKQILCKNTKKEDKICPFCKVSSMMLVWWAADHILTHFKTVLLKKHIITCLNIYNQALGEYGKYRSFLIMLKDDSRKQQKNGESITMWETLLEISYL